MMVLGIETSCDETSAAVVEDGTRVLSNVIYSQTVHQPFGGVVPELAARDHLSRISEIVEQALSLSGIRFGGLDLLAATSQPGLAGALLVGYSYAQGLSLGLGRPLRAVNHVAGHIYAAFIARPDLELPLVALAVSGGHTSLFLMDREHRITLLGRTLDDAAGEAFDKVAKMLGLGYPGGPAIERLAAENSSAPVKFPRAMLEAASLDFSFSGLKTSVLNYLGPRRGKILPDGELPAICDGFQQAVFEVLTEKLRRAVALTGCRTIVVTGGVASNQALRRRLAEFFAESGRGQLVLPDPVLCTDNAAMIASAGYFGQQRDPEGECQPEISARCRWPAYRVS
jgi:N6-L-threonylcarbamoyladenine synthase